MALLGALALVTAACGGNSATTTSDATTTTATATTSTEPVSATTTTTAAPTTTTVAPTTTAAPPTTAAPTTTLPLPSQVEDVTVGLGGGSEEVAVTWEPNPVEDGVTWYNAYFSEMPGGAKTYVRSINPTEMIGDRVGFIDYPRAQTDGQTCYVIAAVSPVGEGPFSAEACFDHTV
jgi:hypothetical protein